MSVFTIIKREFIFESSGSFKECHASTVLAIEDNAVISACFAGTKEKHNDTSIWLGINKGKKWEVKKVAKINSEPHWNPVLFDAKDGSIHLYFKVGKEIPAWKTYVMKSFDNAMTWSSPQELVDNDDSGGRGPVRCKPIHSKINDILAPASVETQERWDAFVDVSSDNGISWKKHEVFLNHDEITNKGIIQPSLWLGDNENIHMLIRSTEGFLYRSDSSDNGKSWSQAYKTELPNNNSGIDVTRLDNGKLVLIFNPIGENWGKRTPLSLLVSDDNGLSWHSRFDIENIEGEFSYPAIVSEGNTLFITHTWNRKDIEYWEIELGD